MEKTQVNCPYCGESSDIDQLHEHYLSCARRKSTCDSCGRQYTRFRDHRCPDHKTECKNCGRGYSNIRNHHCGSILSHLGLHQYDWALKCPESFTHGLVNLRNIDKDTKSLWGNRVPSLLPVASSYRNCQLWAAIFSSIADNCAYDVYQDGDAPPIIEPFDPPPGHEKAAGQEDERPQGFLERKKVEIAATAMFQITMLELEPPICSVSNMRLSPLSGISVDPPEQLESSHHVCERVFGTGLNVTPAGCFADLRDDLGRERLSQAFGSCEQIWLLFPPNEENLKLYNSSAGFSNPLARIGSELRGGIVAKPTQAHVLDLPAGTLYAVFTKTGGISGAINYSTAEGLPAMSRLLIARLPIFRQVSNTVLENLQIYTSALSSTLDMGTPELVSHALRSWVDLLPRLQKLLESDSASTELVSYASETQNKMEEFARNTHYPLQCPCGHSATDIGEHFATKHMLAIGPEDSHPTSVDTTDTTQDRKRKRKINE